MSERNGTCESLRGCSASSQRATDVVASVLEALKYIRPRTDEVCRLALETVSAVLGYPGILMTV